MSWRDTGGRDNGDQRPAFFPAGSVDVRMPGANKVRGVWVQAGANPTTAQISVNGVAQAAQNPAAAAPVPAGTGKLYRFNAPTLNAGDRLQVTLSDPGGVVSVSFMAA